MRKILSLRSYLAISLGLLVVGSFIIFGMFDAKQADAVAGDIRVTVTREADSAAISGATVEVLCTGGAYTQLTGSPTTNGSGIVEAAPQVASSCDNSDSATVRVTMDGYVTMVNATFTYLAASDPNDYAVTGVQFSHKAVVKDELNAALTPTSATAGASLVACIVSTNNVYCPVVLADDNTVANGFVIIKDGYVTTTAADVPLASNRTAGADAQAVTTMTGTNGLDFSHKFVVKDELNVALTPTSATAGANLVACTVSTNNVYCPILLADDNTAANGAVIVKDGYVTTAAADVPLAANRALGTTAQAVTTMTGTNGLDFSHKFLIVDELGAALTVTSATAGASSVACTISTSTAYCPVLLADDNTLTNGLVAAKDGYVTTTAADVPLASNRAAGTTAQGVTTLTTTNGLDFAAKATVVLINTANVLTGATVTAGNSGLVSCAESGTTGTYYCAVPLADTDTTITSVLSTYTTAINNFADRTAATDAQQAITIQMNTTGGSSGGGGGGGSSNNTTNTTTTTTNTTTTTTTTTTETINIVDRINAEKDMVFAQTNPESYFINSGTDSTLGLGSGERGAAVSSFKEAFGFAPTTAAHWEDILNIANGRWPFGIVKTVEARAYTNFKLVYGRNADMKNSTDVNALKMMGYGVRGTVARDMATERASIARFKAVFGHNPATAREWNIMRAIAYSGVVK